MTTDKSRADALTEIEQFLTDVVTAAGLLSYGRTDKKMATRISEQAYELRKHIHLLPASPVEQHEAAPAVELSNVHEVLTSGKGFWRTCSGCHESDVGHSVGEYPYSEILQCDLGAGCAECGGIGAVWDNTDYDDLIEFLEKQESEAEVNSPEPAAMDERVAFEAWMAENRPDAELYRRDMKGSLRFGEYCRCAVQEQWEVWQAARAGGTTHYER
jgi:hypothetical protein